MYESSTADFWEGLSHRGVYPIRLDPKQPAVVQVQLFVKSPVSDEGLWLVVLLLTGVVLFKEQLVTYCLHGCSLNKI